MICICKFTYFEIFHVELAKLSESKKTTANNAINANDR